MRYIMFVCAIAVAIAVMTADAPALERRDFDGEKSIVSHHHRGSGGGRRGGGWRHGGGYYYGGGYCR